MCFYAADDYRLLRLYGMPLSINDANFKFGASMLGMPLSISDANSQFGAGMLGKPLSINDANFQFGAGMLDWASDSRFLDTAVAAGLAPNHLGSWLWYYTPAA